MSFAVKALLIAIVNAWLRMPGGWPSNWETALGQFWGSWIIGLICGDMRLGLIVGGMIQTINLVPVLVGGIVSMDLWFACAMVIPMITEAGMEIEAAVALAAPLAVLGNIVLFTIKQVLICDMWVVPYTRKLSEQGNIKQMGMLQNVYAPAANVIFGTIFVFICVYFGTNAAGAIVDAIPESVLYGFNAVSGLLPAIGMMMFIALLGDAKHLPFYFAGFYLREFFGWGLIEVAIIAGIVAWITSINNTEVNKRIEQATNDLGGDL